MPTEAASNTRRKLLFAASLVVLPALIFYALLFRFALNIPVTDDYDAGLEYLNRTVQIPTFSGKLMYLITAQHNEYKILFGHAALWLQYAVFGNINFKLTCAIGNVFVLLIGWLLWKMFLPRETDLAKRLALFVPVSMLLFQLNYAETLNWALPSLQNINVVFFVLAAIYLLVKPTLGSFWGAVAMLVLAISASGNGFLLVPVGLLILLLNRYYGRIVIWLGATVVCLAGYAYHYNTMSSQSPKSHSIFQTLLHLRPLYVITFMGSAAAVLPGRFAIVFHSRLPAILSCGLGLALLLFFGYMVRKGYCRKNPLVCYCVLFLLLTAVGVAGIRSDLGLMGATSSRYRIYCDLLLIFAWFAIAEEYIQHQTGRLRDNLPVAAILAATILYAALADDLGAHYLRKRQADVILGMTLYQHTEPGQPIGPVLPFPGQTAPMDQWDMYARYLMVQSTQLGTYKPPTL
jgi:hypothetical protein